MRLDIRDVILVLGKTGYGKTWWTRLFTHSAKRLFVYDPLLKYDSVHFFANSSYLLETLEPEIEEFRIGISDPSEISVLGNVSFVKGNNILVLEELSTIFSRGQVTPQWAKRLIFLGRHRACSIIAIAQRPYSIPIDLRSQANRVISFAQMEGDDLSWLHDIYGNECIKKLPFLPPFTCIDYDGQEVCQYSIKTGIKSVFHVELESRPSNLFRFSEEKNLCLSP